MVERTYDERSGRGEMKFTFEARDLYGANLIGYKIYWNAGNEGQVNPGRYFLAAITDLSIEHFEIRNLVPGKNYRVYVSVVSDVGESEQSDGIIIL